MVMPQRPNYFPQDYSFNIALLGTPSFHARNTNPWQDTQTISTVVRDQERKKVEIILNNYELILKI
jgi:hypothetical protein